MLPKQKELFNEFYNSARYNNVLDDRISLMIHLGVSMALGCYPCMKYYLEQVDDYSLTDDEINAIEAIVMAVAAGKVKQQFNEVLLGGDSKSCTEGCLD
jgi:alkylhydroperoxidase/carboxymuconolactone decarboxylase family protein YurZ